MNPSFKGKTELIQSMEFSNVLYTLGVENLPKKLKDWSIGYAWPPGYHGSEENCFCEKMQSRGMMKNLRKYLWLLDESYNMKYFL